MAKAIRVPSGLKRALPTRNLSVISAGAEMVAELLGGRRRVTQYQWGGGRPTYLTTEQIDDLFGHFASLFTFEPGAEISVEVDPRVTTPEHLAALAHHGFNRLSAGVQDLDREVQEIIGRVQPLEQTERLVEAARRLGFAGGINLDLIYGLPGQRAESFADTARAVVALAADRIRTGDDDVVIAAGTESMSMVPMMGNKVALNDAVFRGNEHIAIAYGMGITAENVARQWKVSREDQDAFAVASHRKAAKAIETGAFRREILPYEIDTASPDLAKGEVAHRRRMAEVDEGPRPDSTVEALGKLRTVFAARGTVTAGNAPGITDGAAATVVASERAVERHGLTPLARIVATASAGVDPSLMGLGPIPATRKALARAGLSTSEQFLADMSAQIADLQSEPGRLKQTVEQSSLDVWNNSMSGINADSSTVSYYTKGTVLGFLLDARVRHASGGKRSLDDVMRTAYQRYGGARGFTPEQFQAVASEVAGSDLSEWFRRALASTEELDYGEMQEWFGLRFGDSAAAGRARWGLTVRADATEAQRAHLGALLAGR